VDCERGVQFGPRGYADSGGSRPAISGMPVLPIECGAECARRGLV
jgi:hypothetical protein